MKISLALSMITLAFFGLSLTSTGEVKSDSLLSHPLSAHTESDLVAFKIRTAEVDPFGIGAMNFELIPQLRGRYGTSFDSGSIAAHDLIFQYGNFKGSSFLQTNVNGAYGAQLITIRLIPNHKAYPFDGYSAQWSILALDAPALDTPVPLAFSDDSESVPGFNVSIEQSDFRGDGKVEEQLANGQGSITWDISRSNSDKFTVLIIAVLLIVGAFASILMTWAVATRRRPPSLAALGWLAAFLFALFEIRNQLPGEPPSGIPFDKFIFFPALIALAVSTVMNLLQWVKRDDWDLENPMFAVMGTLHRMDERKDEDS